MCVEAEFPSWVKSIAAHAHQRGTVSCNMYESIAICSQTQLCPHLHALSYSYLLKHMLLLVSPSPFVSCSSSTSPYVQSAAYVSVMLCGNTHMLCRHCVAQKISSRWIGARITFGFLEVTLYSSQLPTASYPHFLLLFCSASAFLSPSFLFEPLFPLSSLLFESLFPLSSFLLESLFPL